MEQMANSTPIVDLDSMPNLLRVILDRIQSYFQTPQAPINTPQCRSSCSSPACAPISLRTHLACKRLLSKTHCKPPPTHLHQNAQPTLSCKKEVGTYNRSTNGGASLIGWWLWPNYHQLAECVGSSVVIIPASAFSRILPDGTLTLNYRSVGLSLP